MTPKKTALVISAHAADFVWRCGGAIALHAEKGYDVTVACLSFGERGESARLWKEGKSLDEVKAIRRADARVRALQTSKDIRHDVQNADRADLERRANRWMRD